MRIRRRRDAGAGRDRHRERHDGRRGSAAESRRRLCIGARGRRAAESPFFKAIRWLVGGTFVIGLVAVLVLRSTSPETYRHIGRTVMEETPERDSLTRN